MKMLIILLSLAFVGGSSHADIRGWTTTGGKTIEAEFVTYIGGNVILRNAKGKQIKMPPSQFSAEDLSFIELQIPRSLIFSFQKNQHSAFFPTASRSYRVPCTLIFLPK